MRSALAFFTGACVGGFAAITWVVYEDYRRGTHLTR